MRTAVVTRKGRPSMKRDMKFSPVGLMTMKVRSQASGRRSQGKALSVTRMKRMTVENTTRASVSQPVTL